MVVYKLNSSSANEGMGVLKGQHGLKTHVHIMLRILEFVLIRHRK